MKKRILAIVLSAVMFCSLMPAAFAADRIVEADVPESIRMESIGHGEFVINKSPLKALKPAINTAASAEKGDTVLVTPTKDEEIFQTSDGKYLVQATESSYLLTDKVSVDVDSVENSRSMMEAYDIPSKTIDEMKAVAAAQKAIGNDEFSVDLYVPSAISGGDIVPYAGTTTVSYYNYKDKTGYSWKMKDVSIKYSNLHSSDWLKYQGSGTLSKAKATVNVILAAAGTINTIGKFTTAAGVVASLYDLYVAIRGPVVSSDGRDYMSSMIIFDRIEKQTHVSNATTGTYQLAKTSHKVWVNRLDTYQFYAKKGVSQLVKPNVNKVHYSQYWGNGEKAVSRIGWEDYVKCTLYGVTVKLNGVN